MFFFFIAENYANIAYIIYSYALISTVSFTLFLRWTGVIGALVEDDADIGATYFFVTEARSQVVEFSPAITEGILR